jgi:tRNA U34 5-methylaminomethyl-2-thiouridine-forming methyltransferase MnmC
VQLNRLIITEDGSHTIFVPELNEHYHSVHGAVQESNIVFLDSGYEYCKADPVCIFEAGFGTGLNAFLTAVRSSASGRKVIYTSIEKYPVEPEIIEKINYPEISGETVGDLYRLIHEAEWGKLVKISDSFSLLKIMGDLITEDIPGLYDLVYFDAFGPDKQPEMWKEPVFRKISLSVKEGGVLVTYSAKGEVKRILRSCGFTVSLLPGPPGKREMIRAVKQP